MFNRFSDGDFDDIEKRYIGYVVSEFGLEKEKSLKTLKKIIRIV